MRQFVLNLVRQPLVHFLVLGALLGLAFQWFAERRVEDVDKTIRITATEIARLDAQWRARWNRAPTPQELNGLIQAQLRERVLYQEAIAMGLDRDDPVIQRVVVQKLERIARDLIEFSLSPTDQDLEQYYEEHAEEYRPDSLITFTHVFVDPDRRGDSAVDDANRIVAELRSLEPGTTDAEGFGDPFMLQSYYPEKPRQRIGSLFGAGFAGPIFELTPGEWHGPVLSGYGLHAVYVHGRSDFPIPPLDEVREQVTQDWVDVNRREITESYFADLLSRYDVVIEGQSDEEPPEAEPAQGS